MPVLARITKPNRLSWNGATNSMITQSTPMIALNRVKTLARTISADGAAAAHGDVVDLAPGDALGDLGGGEPTALGAGRGMGRRVARVEFAPASMCVMHPTVRAG